MSIKIDWVEIPGGIFTYGLSEDWVRNILSPITTLVPSIIERRSQKLYDETPERQVELPTFYISRFLITCSQEYEFAQSKHRYSYCNVFTDNNQQSVLHDLKKDAKKHRQHPATTQWHFAVAFCDWLGARLPTSAEWEKAARGTDGRLYPWGNEWDASRGSFTIRPGDNRFRTSAVNAHPTGQSPYGVMDMAGNTFEWTCSVELSITGGTVLRDQVICRSCSGDFTALDNNFDPDWLRNRVTAINHAGMYGGDTPFIGFRPVLDKWQKQTWSGL